MPTQKIIALAQRVAGSDPNDAAEQRLLLEELIEIRMVIDQRSNARVCEYLDGAISLMTFMQHLGRVGGSQVIGVVATVLEAAHQHMSLAIPANESPKSSTAFLNGGASDVVGDMLLGQILIRKGYISEQQLRQAVELQHTSGLRFGEALMKLGCVVWAQLEEGLKYQDACRQLVEGVTQTRPAPSQGPEPPKTLELDVATDGGLQLMSDVSLGEILVRNQLVTKDQLANALARQRGSGMRIGEVLVDSGACNWDQINYAIQLQGQLRRYAS